MRCPNCGTENEPDSRFCGGCGARMHSSGLVAPTQKISDDAPYPTSGPSSIPPQNYVPGSVPPQNVSGPATLPPQNYQTPVSIPPQNSPYPAPSGFGATTPATIPPAAYQPQTKSIPPHNSYGTGPTSVPPQNASIPPRASTQPPRAQSPTPTPQGTPSQPRTKSNGVPSLSRRQTPAVSDPSISAPPKRRLGLIITVLVLDLALAGAGVYLLTEGLA
ncbi:MAG: zinc-ribbon domain-containing protein [Kofleriaceae bacterium]